MLYLEERVANQQATFWGRLRARFSISPRFARFIGIALGAAVVAFLIWDLCKSWDRLSVAGKTLSILLIVIESAGVICAVVGIFAVCSLIPVIGQVLMVSALIVSILLIFMGGPEPEKTPGEKFVDSMKAGWVSKLDDPPAPLLEYSISPTDVQKNKDYTLQITAKNNTGHDINIVGASTAEQFEEQAVSQTDITAIKFNFTTGTDKVCLFSNKSFSDLGDAIDGKVTFTGPNGVFKTKLLTPNGIDSTLTGYDYRISAAHDKPETKLIFKNGETFTVKVIGKGGVGDSDLKDFTLKIIEERPGEACALTVQTLHIK